MTEARLYFMMVELSTGHKAALLIRRFPDTMDAQLTGRNGFLRQVSGGFHNPIDFDSLTFWELLAFVENGFQQVHGISYEYVPSVPETTPDQWAENLEKRAADPRYIAVERPGSPTLHYGIRVALVSRQ